MKKHVRYVPAHNAAAFAPLETRQNRFIFYDAALASDGGRQRLQATIVQVGRRARVLVDAPRAAAVWRWCGAAFVGADA